MKWAGWVINLRKEIYITGLEYMWLDREGWY
jgi:hypothetical protein